MWLELLWFPNPPLDKAFYQATYFGKIRSLLRPHQTSGSSIDFLRGKHEVPNYRAARLFFLKIFSYQHGLISTYMLIKIPIIFLPTLADSGFLKNFLYQGGVKSTVSWVFEDLKFKISEGYDPNWCFPDSAQLAV